MIELCGWFRHKEDRAAPIIEAVGDNVAIGYVVPAPVWKSSYRLVFDDEPKRLKRLAGRRPRERIRHRTSSTTSSCWTSPQTLTTMFRG